MSNHLRHCPRHHKPLPCPHCALAAKPAQAPAVVMPPVPPVKRGPKPKFGQTMTPAQRKALSRQNQKLKLQDGERRKLAAELMKIYRRQQGVIVDGKNHKATEERRKTARQQYREHLGSLLQLSVAELQQALRVQEDTPDSHGRLHNERSGDKTRGASQDVENILDAKQHGSSLFYDEDQDPTLAAGFKSRPEGTGADEFETNDSTADSADNRTGSAKPQYEPTTEDKWRDKAISSMIGQMIYDSKLGGARCLFCSAVFPVELGAYNHLVEQYGKGQRAAKKYWEYVDAVATLNSQSLPGYRMSVDLEPRDPAYQYYKRINDEMDRVRKLARKKPKKTRDIPVVKLETSVTA